MKRIFTIHSAALTGINNICTEAGTGAVDDTKRTHSHLAQLQLLQMVGSAYDFLLSESISFPMKYNYDGLTNKALYLFLFFLQLFCLGHCQSVQVTQEEVSVSALGVRSYRIPIETLSGHTERKTHRPISIS